MMTLLRFLHPPLDVSVLDSRALFCDLEILHPCDLERPVLPVLQGVGEQVPCVPFVMDGQRFGVRPGLFSVRVPVVERDALPVGDGRLQQGVQVLDPFEGLFDEGAFEDKKPLDGRFLLGYDCQREALKKSSEKNQANENTEKSEDIN